MGGEGEKGLLARNRPLVLVILDGWGLSPHREGNAIALADTPNMTRYWQEFPHATLQASGEAVGLPAGQMGNSEVGHLNIGAGRVVYQDLTRINLAVKDGTFFRNPVLVEAMDKAKQKGSLHLLGLLSDGGVHSHIDHLKALLQMAADHGLKQVFVHAFLDGRDVPPSCARTYLEEIEEFAAGLGTGQIATVMGRYWAMDRDRRWERVARAYGAMVDGRGFAAASAVEALEMAYARDETDEFVQPTVVVAAGQPLARIQAGDTAIFFNFRPDRAREITRSLIDRTFSGFERRACLDIHFVCLTEYDRTIDAPVAFDQEKLVNTLGEVLARNGKNQLRLAETEKYAHVTFFFNGGVEEPNPGEERLLIPSPKVPTYDFKPEMSAPEVTEAFLERITWEKYDCVIMNYANSDMVGHTGILEAAEAAVAAVDSCVGQVVEETLRRGGAVLITADHGNAEEMTDPEGAVHTAHTTYPVPFILASLENKNISLRAEGVLSDIAPTILQLLGVPKPVEMTGRSLIQEVNHPHLAPSALEVEA